jgi:hypothetical protein
MTEQEWLRYSGRSWDMLLELFRRGGHITGKRGHRKLRLFAVAACRRIWPRLRKGRELVEAAEGYADRQTRKGKAAQEEVYRAAMEWKTSHRTPDNVVAAVAQLNDWTVAHAAASHVPYLVEQTRGVKAREEEEGRQCDLLRDIFGNPFRPIPPLASSVLQWDSGIVKRLAEAAYEDRWLPAGHLDPQRLAVLADALEEAGVTDEVILGHLRQQGAVHVRGCFALDLSLGR